MAPQMRMAPRCENHSPAVHLVKAPPVKPSSSLHPKQLVGPPSLTSPSTLHPNPLAGTPSLPSSSKLIIPPKNKYGNALELWLQNTSVFGQPFLSKPKLEL